MRNMKAQAHKPSYEDLYDVMKEICSVNNIWAFCLKWEKEKPKLFNAFIEMCTYFRGDDDFLKLKTKDTEFMYNKRIKKDVLVLNNSRESDVVWWDPNSKWWVGEDRSGFSKPREEH